jgi:menaquinol-cytochrome c reductase cytochrome b/c subunit
MPSTLEIKAAIAGAALSCAAIGALFLATTIYRSHGESAPEGVLVKPDKNGKTLFAKSCAPCHGREGDGGEDAPSLLKLEISEAHISLLVHSGIKGEMPSFAKKYSEEEIKSIVNFVKGLGKEK